MATDPDPDAKRKQEIFDRCMVKEQGGWRGYRFFAILLGIGVPISAFLPKTLPLRQRQIPFLISGLGGILLDYLFVRKYCRSCAGLPEEQYAKIFGVDENAAVDTLMEQVAEERKSDSEGKKPETKK
ncbi:hypothetical protein AAMO2058_000203600 [Amorphochlora amoebiformis]